MCRRLFSSRALAYLVCTIAVSATTTERPLPLRTAYAGQIRRARAARYLVEKEYEPRYEVALEVLKSLPYDRWRQSDPTDTLRFHALRLHEVGMIKSDPSKLIAQAPIGAFSTSSSGN